MISRWEQDEDEATILARFKNALASALREELGSDVDEYYRRTFESRFSVVHGSPPSAASSVMQVLNAAQSRRELAFIIEHLLEAASEVPTAYGGITTYVQSVAKAVEDSLRRHPAMRLN